MRCWSRDLRRRCRSSSGEGQDRSWPAGCGWWWNTVLSGLLVLVGRRLPSLSPDKLLELGWVVALPLVVAQDLVVSVIAVSIR